MDAHSHGHAHAHESHHGHHHGHGHSHVPANFDRAFAIGTALNAAFLVVEVVYGLAAHSLALLADAGHNASDVLALLLAWAATWLTRRRPSGRFTYGSGRTTIIASVLNGLLLLFVSGGIAWEAVGRLGAPESVATGTVMAVAAIGIAVNGVTALLFARGRHGDLNVRGAFLHMLGDALIAAGVVVSGFVASVTGWAWLDPVVSLLIVVAIGWGTLGLLTEALRLSLDAVPRGIDEGAVRGFLAGQPGVAHVHDLHIWPISTRAVALTAHLVRPGASVDDALLVRITHDLQHRFGIEHATLQVESGFHDHGCDASPRELQPANQLASAVR